jgi:hypothetical protein
VAISSRDSLTLALAVHQNRAAWVGLPFFAAKNFPITRRSKFARVGFKDAFLWPKSFASMMNRT